MGGIGNCEVWEKGGKGRCLVIMTRSGGPWSMWGVSAEIRLDDDFFFIECDNGQDRGYSRVHGVRNGQKRIILLLQSFKYIPIVSEKPVEGEKCPIECHQLKVTPSQPPLVAL
jgi:hypothetical protein